jgi:uncharacterized protein YdeI (YjbR/CyaY-like superfamily)
VWLVTYKKHIQDKYVSVDEVLDELLCLGWIDGIRRKLDAHKTMQLISPRKTQHRTNTYKERYARLLKEKRVAASGKKAVAVSKRLDLWNFMADVDNLKKPNDFVAALKQQPTAFENSNHFAASAQRFILRWIKLSKTEATRKKRIGLAAKLASQNKKIPGV